MNRLTLLGAAALAFAVSAPVYAQGNANPAVERGRYLVQITGCHDCHSPKIEGMTPDLKRALSWRPGTTPLPSAAKGEVHASLDLTAWQGPWGASVASNLTPDAATGIGTRYTEAAFLTTMRTGKKPNGTMILPPMPADVYKNMTDDDLKAIFAYLRTIPPVSNHVPDPVIAPPPPPVKGS